MPTKPGPKNKDTQSPEKKNEGIPITIIAVKDTQSSEKKSDHSVLIALIALLGTIITAIVAPILVDKFKKTPTPTSLPPSTLLVAPLIPTSSASSTSLIAPLITPFINVSETATISISTPTALTGKSPGDSALFFIYPEYNPSGWMGDTGDLKDPIKGPDGVTFEYEACGRGPRQDSLRFLSNGDLNLEPAKFAGVLYLNPPNNIGTYLEGGFDLRGFKSITWEARSLLGEVNVEFIIGGVNWRWNDQNKIETVPYPDSIPRDSLGIKTLTQTWQEFPVSLENHPLDDFQNIIGGFAWVIDWGSNGVFVEDPGTCPPQPKTFKIEIRNIRYEK